MIRDTTCLLCGITSQDVKPRLVAWREGTGSEYQVIPRCSRSHECRARVFENGDEWIVREPLDLEAIKRTRIGEPLPMPEIRHG